MRTEFLFPLILWIGSLALAAEEEPIRVAVFAGEGVGPSSEQLIESLDEGKKTGMHVSRITTEQILKGGLAGVDVLVHPGGSGGGQGRALGEEGRNAIRTFVRKGGGFLGVCGGAYLATNDYDWSLDLIDAKVVDRRHWARGKGTVTLQLSPKGKEFFGNEGEKMSIYYAQGPLLGRRSGTIRRFRTTKAWRSTQRKSQRTMPRKE